MRRLILLALVAIGLAPGTWWRSPPRPHGSGEPLIVLKEAVVPWSEGNLRLLGAWHLDSRNRHFHGYSALVVLDDRTLLAGSDRGRTLHFSPPGAPDESARFSSFAGDRAVAKWQSDIEALARDPASGRIWAAYEGSNEIARYERDHTGETRVAPTAMRDWPSNGGPEAMARLADGRFIVLSEGDPSYFAGDVPGLLFPADPVGGSAPIAFRFRPPEGFSAVDIAELPDGRAIILTRRVDWGLPPRFSGKLVVADPAGIAEGKAWRWEAGADLEAPLPMDNYEGIAVQPLSDRQAVLWLISDDNASEFQRTLLLKLLWSPIKEARGADRAPR